jgi:hypothetical protein
MTITLAEAIETHGVDVHEHLDRDAIIPILTGLQVQGDVAFIPTRPSAKPGVPVPAEGVVLVRGENGGHTHRLLADGPVTWSEAAGAGVDLGVFTVPEGATAFVAHDEHGYTGHAPGAYIARRQVEQADQVRKVAD